MNKEFAVRSVSIFDTLVSKQYVIEPDKGKETPQPSCCTIKEYKDRLKASSAFMELFARKLSKEEFLKSAIEILQNFTGCSHTGIRMFSKQDDIPFISQIGYSDDFLKAEDCLSAKYDNCICTRIFSASHEPQDSPFISAYGSFCCGNLYEYYERLSLAEQTHFRGTCLRSGFRSLSVIPIKYEEEILGVIHIADNSIGKTYGNAIEFIESVSPLIGECINKYNVEVLQTEVPAGGLKTREGKILQVIHGELNHKEDIYRAAFENTGSATLIIEEDMKISHSNFEFRKLCGCTREEIEGKVFFWELFPKDEMRKIENYYYMHRARIQAVPENMEASIVDKAGHIKTVILTISMLPGTKKTVVSFLDITERKKIETELRHLSYHDSLTGLYNRAYFEKEMLRLDAAKEAGVGIIVCDVDGLKLANDALGHDMGDYLLAITANILKKSFRPGDVVSRIGGDEFAILLSNCSKDIINNICARINNTVSAYNGENPDILLHISIGYAVREDTVKSMSELFKTADSNMYHEKLQNSQTTRGAIVQTIMKALESRDFVTDGHTDRLQKMVMLLAGSVNLPDYKVQELRLLAQFHDIGKVGIKDKILFKCGPLDFEEAMEICKHCEIGYRIAQSSPELVPIADWILKHHERWDGSGYPLGLKGEEIPIECRILSIVDAYDAMTNDRPYRKAMRRDDAVRELLRCSGKHFDPKLVDRFIRL